MFTCSDESGPVLGQVTPEDDGSAVLLSWSGGEPRSRHGPQQLHYVLEWTSVPLANLQWKRVNKEENSTSITGTVIIINILLLLQMFYWSFRRSTGPSDVLLLKLLFYIDLFYLIVSKN